LSSKSSSKKPSLKKSTKKAPNKAQTKKLTQTDNQRLSKIIAKTPPIEKLDPKIYQKLQSAISEAVEKTLPEAKKWLNSEFGRKVVAEDCPVEICSSCGNDCPVEICSSCGNDCPVEICSSCGNDCPVEICGSCDNERRIIGKVAKEAVDDAMNAAFRSALEEKTKKGKVSEGKMRANTKKRLKKALKK
jgi:hypothetical protein